MSETEKFIDFVQERFEIFLEAIETLCDRREQDGFYRRKEEKKSNYKPGPPRFAEKKRKKKRKKQNKGFGTQNSACCTGTNKGKNIKNGRLKDCNERRRKRTGGKRELILNRKKRGKENKRGKWEWMKKFINKKEEDRNWKENG